MEFTYGEFQRRFTAHWTNLSVELFLAAGGEENNSRLIALEPHFALAALSGSGIHGLWRGRVIERNGVREVAQMLTENCFHDHLYISDHKNILAKRGIHLKIKNDRLGTYWDKASSPSKLIDFQNAAIF